MTGKPQGSTRSAGRGRVATALCTAGVVAIALSGNLVGAGGQEVPVPGEPVAQAPTQVAADPQPAGDTTVPATTTTTPTATTTTTPASDPTAADPSGAANGADPPPAAASHADAGAAPASSAAPASPATAPVPARTAPTPPAARPADTLDPRPLPLGVLAGPTDSADGDLRACAPAKTAAKAAATQGKKQHARRKPAAAGLTGLGTADGERAPADAEDSGCVMADRVPGTTTSPDRAHEHSAAGGAATTLRNAEGVPTSANPTMSLALPGPVPVGVPNFFIDKFRIPPFLLPIYQAAGVQYGIRWEVLAAINEIETDYGRNLNISSAGALGWMQFMPQTWKQYGVDANRDGRKDPFNPVDAIFAAARYLRAAGADEDLRGAIFSYNHADWYVDSVLMRARLIGGLPSDLVGSLNGLTQGHFPVYAKARYADDLAERAADRRARTRQDIARPIDAEPTRRGIDVFANAGAPAIAVQDGTITAIGETKRLGRYVRLRDVYGNTYTYAQLKKVAQLVPVPKPKTQSAASIARELALPARDPKPTRAATAGRRTGSATPALDAAARHPLDALAKPAAAAAAADAATAVAAVRKERLFANPGRSRAYANGGARQIAGAETTLAAGATLTSYLTGAYGLDASDVVLERMLAGRRVIAGTILGRVGRTSNTISPHLHFEIRPAGRGAPRIDPKPILDGWKLLESTAIYRAAGRNALLDPAASHATIGQILLMSKEALAQRVLANPRIEIYSCGRRDIAAGIIDRRVLATLEFLAASGLQPTVSSLHCGHGYYTASGNVSEHAAGSAVDIAKVNGIPIAGHQGEGSITDITIRRLLTLQGTVKPHQIISLMRYEGEDNTLALGDHADHIHVGFRPEYAAGSAAAHDIDAALKPSQWMKLIGRLGEIDNPVVATKPSKYAIPVPVPRASTAHRGE